MKTTAGAGKTSLGPTELQCTVEPAACALLGPRLPYAAAAMPDSAGGGIGLGPGPEGGLAPPAPPGVTTPLYTAQYVSTWNQCFLVTVIEGPEGCRSHTCNMISWPPASSEHIAFSTLGSPR
jgi:hypothetical protein